MCSLAACADSAASGDPHPPADGGAGDPRGPRLEPDGSYNDASNGADSAFELDSSPGHDAEALGRDASSGDSGTPPTQDNGFQCTQATPKFMNDVLPLVKSCGNERCHGEIGLGNFFALWVNKPAIGCTDGRERVDPKHPERSYILNKLSGHNICGGARMPKLGTPLSQSDMQVIADWICNGAQNN